MSSLSAAITKFALDLFQQLRLPEDNNVLYSPVSIVSALAMVHLGAKGNTAWQMEKVLHFNDITEKATEKSTGCHVGESGNVDLQFQKLLTELNEPSDTYELEIANRIYGEKKFQFLQEYLDDLKKFYLAKVESLDFQNYPEESGEKINSWVKHQTHEKIKDLFPSGTIDASTVLVLVNAVYFKGQWDQKFDKYHITEAKFWLNKNVSKSVQMMKDTRDFPFAFLEDVQAKILEMPYKDKELSMFVLLPNEIDGLQKLEDKLTADNLEAWSSPESMHISTVDVCFPPFKLQEKYHLEDMLSAMGMEDVFSPGEANLSGMTGSRGLWVSKVVHKSFVEVNEEGTEESAAFDVEVKLTASQKENKQITKNESFPCDHPFLFFIKHKETKSILFFGRVSFLEE